MTRPYHPVNTEALTTYSIARREHKAAVAQMASLPEAGASARELLASMPDLLGGAALRSVARAMVDATHGDRPVVVATGAHLIKVGCGPVIIDLVRRGVIKAIACNGAAAIHDVELATGGETSEEVADTIRDGTFGMVTETLTFFNDVVALAGREEIGLGDAVGKLLVDRDAPNRDRSLFAVAREEGVPVCVHVAVGTDTIHVSSGMDGGLLGAASLRDFRLICDVVSDLGAKPGDPSGVGGVWCNIGSAVVMPEVFLKAVSVARNLGANLDAMVAANFDMIRHYRPTQNVITRPVCKGRGFEVIGQHEILLPLLRQAVVEGLAEANGS